MTTSYELAPFSAPTLFRALANERQPAEEIGIQERARYLADYLAQVGARTLITEFAYTDGDYLEDFSSYYVRCFEAYERRCKRLHFFAAAFDDSEFQELVAGALVDKRSREITESYLGFIVARPLPSAVVGRTVLATYPSDNGRRHYRTLLEYSANLFGVALRVRSLAYQEQDSVLAACATVSLWSAFHKTAELFGTTAPRPAEITRLANGVASQTRPIPSHGLSVQQMAHAIREVGLDPEVIPASGNIPLASLIYAHVRSGLPVILALEIENVGYHAITLTGYSLKPDRVHGQEVAGGETAIPLVGLRIDEFYCHDDQIGPFARLQVRPAAKKYPILFEGSWIDRRTRKVLELRPIAVLVPVYNKIRLGFVDVQKWLTRLHELLSLAFADIGRFEWDVYLTTVNEFKANINLERDLSNSERMRLLLKQQPRFLWRAVLRFADQKRVELLFDATDMARSFPIFNVIWHDDQFRTVLVRVLEANATRTLVEQILQVRFLQLLLVSAKRFVPTP